jgi:hypothetical protein
VSEQPPEADPVEDATPVDPAPSPYADPAQDTDGPQDETP